MRELTPRERLQLQGLTTDVKYVVERLPIIISGTFLLLSIGVFGFQIYVFLKTGRWLPISLEVVVHALGPSYELWKNAPSWIGLKRVVSATLDFLPLSIVLLALGVGITLAATVLLGWVKSWMSPRPGDGNER